MGKIICVNCGSDMVENHYNYETSNTDFHCNECGADFTHRDITYCRRRICIP